jgi:hypothetical protein
LCGGRDRREDRERPEREGAYLAAVATWCPEYKPTAYMEAMRAVVDRYPDDLDARASTPKAS